MKVALVHDWLTGMRGGEKVLEVFCELFPDAHLYTLLYNRGSLSNTIEDMDIGHLSSRNYLLLGKSIAISYQYFQRL